jgi:hypothetical protein
MDFYVGSARRTKGVWVTTFCDFPFLAQHPLKTTSFLLTSTWHQLNFPTQSDASTCPQIRVVHLSQGTLL